MTLSSLEMQPAPCLENGRQLAAQFEMPGEPIGMLPIGGGNINDTYLAVYRTSCSEARCVIQRINLHVFRQPESLMRNYRRVTLHVHRRLENERDGADRLWQLPRMIPCKDGADLHIAANGDHWRAITLIDSAISYEQVQNLSHAREAGAVLGQFHRLVMDLDPDSLDITLPGFHRTPQYLAAFDRALVTPAAQQLLDRDPRTRDLCRFVEQRRPLCVVLENALAEGRIALRIMHGDPKISNILIDTITGRGTSIIDLDTVGPGLIHWDYGDAVRSICNPAGEETTDLDQVSFDQDLFRAFNEGYIGQIGPALAPGDRSLFYEAIRLISFELGLRFLQDHLAGDIYFKTRHPGHNRDRAAVQIRLCEKIEMAEPQIRACL